jgi:type II secretory pathway pseudopilin PulG
MVPKARRIRCRRGMTLIGTLIAVTILLIALIGTSTFRYSAALDARRATAHTAAARVALALCESWRGLYGDETHDPTLLTTSDMSIAKSSWEGHSSPGDFTLLGNYAVVLDDDNPDSVNYYATLSWKDVQPGLRALNVDVSWAQRAPGADGDEDVDKSYVLTVYAQTN